MAPLPSARPEKEKRVRTQAFAADLEAQLPAAASSRSPGPLLDEIEKCISTFPGNLGTAAASKCQEIDSSGTTLWNICTRLRRNHDTENTEAVPIILVLTRVFAFLLLCCAHDHGKSTTGNILRLAKIGIKAAKNCLERKELGLAFKVLEKVGKYEDSLKGCQSELGLEDGQEPERVSAEYFVLRTALAWYQKQYDIVEHMYKNCMASKRNFDSNTAESLADVLYEMGKDLITSQQYQLSVKWLERAYEVLTTQELDRLSMDASELRISIIQSLVKALLQLKDDGALEKARGFVELLQNELGDKLIVLLLRLELVNANTADPFDSLSYSEVLHRMIRVVILSDGNFKLLMFHIRKLNNKSPSLACKVLDDLLRLRVIKEGREELLERVVVTRLWMTTSQMDAPDAPGLLETLLSTALDNFNQPIGSSATLAAHMLLWKRIESNYAQGQYDIAEKWCRLALHPIFEKSGDVNMARISRKLLLCALARQDTGSARGAFGSMSDTAKNEPMTRFLMYKIAIRSKEFELAAECLQIISTSSNSDPTLLYACCLDSLQVNNKSQTLTALQLVLEKSNYAPLSPVHLPSLLRVTIGITSSLLEESQNAGGEGDYEVLVDKLCKMFEGAVSSMKKPPNSVKGTDVLWTSSEVDWFSKNSYNTAIKHISIWPPRYVLRMLVCCTSFISQYPSDISEQISDDLDLRKMFCEFSAGTLLVALARSEDNIEQRSQDYLRLRKHVSSFDKLLVERLPKLEEVQSQDLLQKLAVLLAFDFEAACQLKAWDDLGEIILKINITKSVRALELMADCILSIQPPTQVLIVNLKRIINEACSLDAMDNSKLAKYMRCLFQIALSDNAGVAEQLLDQIRDLAEESRDIDQPYPTEELDWIATKSFNHAIDLYCNGQDEACKTWVGKALNITHFCDDGGALERLLQNKLMGLKFDV
ncbi:uncharacterized protein BP5553_03599 [Venustampulla echinocandica]|uniref:Protein ZIP4 homolog n=1 Tax=Venustampulla echinocandica TaxID=2656787 RepID=A0A370TUS2_9HELO|nr:uncharacterized protein BP5553_03599 [Venustampulla echinocandica]RDL39259.1 hypothetical protein BP5553_03599 [Venustampulla echinocandica]